MSTKRIIIAAVFLLAVSLNYSCDKESTSAAEELYSIDKKEIQEQDT